MSSIEAPEFNFLPMRVSLETRPVFRDVSHSDYVLGIVVGHHPNDTDCLNPLTSDTALSASFKHIATAVIARVSRGIGTLGISTK